MVDNGTVTKINIGKTAKVTSLMWTRIIPLAGEVEFFYREIRRQARDTLSVGFTFLNRCR